MPVFKHPFVVEGVVGFEGEQYPIRNGLVECPLRIGAEWPLATQATDDAEAPAPKKAKK
jgi:hypothetical protein